MKTGSHALLLCSILLFTGSALAFTDVYFSGGESPPFWEPIPWAITDSVFGSMRTNDCFDCIFGGPYVTGTVRMGCAGSTCVFGPGVQTNLPRVLIPEYGEWVRQNAVDTGFYFEPSFDARAVLRIRGEELWVWWGIRGVPMDTVFFDHEVYTLDSTNFFYFDCPVRIAGILAPYGHTLIVASSTDIGLDDNITLEGSDSLSGEPIDDATSIIMLVAQRSIIVQNTIENGRNNSAGLGDQQTNPDSTDILVTAALISLGDQTGLTIAQQNRPWDSYICPCVPDNRGAFRLCGFLMQRHRGYLFSPYNEGTGYRARLTFDSRLSNWTPPGTPIPVLLTVDPDTLDFGQVILGETATDTVILITDRRINFSGAFASFPFSTSVGFAFNDTVIVPVDFEPQSTGIVSGLLFFFVDGNYVSVPLRGEGIEPPGPASDGVLIQPNPFNPSATISFLLTKKEQVTLSVYNIMGQRVRTLVNERLAAGSHRVVFDGSALASGLYFARLQIGNMTTTSKLLLVK